MSDCKRCGTRFITEDHAEWCPGPDRNPELPRRIRIDRWTPAEHAIGGAIEAVEAAGADVALTDAVVLLQAARERVADFVDGVEGTRTVPRPYIESPSPVPPSAPSEKTPMPSAASSASVAVASAAMPAGSGGEGSRCVGCGHPQDLHFGNECRGPEGDCCQCPCSGFTPAPPCDPWVIECTASGTRDWSALWWKPDRRGYTTILSDAGRYTEFEAKKQERHRPGTDIAHRLSDVLPIARLRVDRDTLRRESRKPRSFTVQPSPSAAVGASSDASCPDPKPGTEGAAAGSVPTPTAARDWPARFSDLDCVTCDHPASMHTRRYESEEKGEYLFACAFHECECESCITVARPDCGHDPMLKGECAGCGARRIMAERATVVDRCAAAPSPESTLRCDRPRGHDGNHSVWSRGEYGVYGHTNWAAAAPPAAAPAPPVAPPAPPLTRSERLSELARREELEAALAAVPSVPVGELERLANRIDAVRGTIDGISPGTATEIRDALRSLIQRGGH